jgi:hypothetical protein
VKQPLLVVLGLLMGSMFSAQARSQEGSPSPEAAPAVVEATEAAAPAVPAGPEALPPPTDPAFSQKLLVANVLRARAIHDRSRVSNVLWWFSSQEKRTQRFDAVYFPNGNDDSPMGRHRLLAGLWCWRAILWKLRPFVHGGSPNGRRQRSNASGSNITASIVVYAISRHVLHHYTRANLRRVCRANEI